MDTSLHKDVGGDKEIEDNLLDKQLLLLGEEKPEYKFDGLTSMQIWGYSVGHIFNDLCASSWFNFLLFYLTKVLNFEAGSYTMLFGQIADALGTPSAGILSDKYNTRFGKRTPWYVLSFVMVQLTFLPMWCYPIMSSIFPMENESFKTFFFIFFPAAFNYFWAFGYIAHISLVPSVTCSRVRRDILNTRRNTFSFFANMILLVIALLVFQIVDDSDQQFQLIGIICSVVGTVFCVIFFLTFHEVPLTLACNEAVKELKQVLELRTQSEVNIQLKKNEIDINQISIDESNGGATSTILNAQKFQNKLEQEQQKKKKEYVEVVQAEVFDAAGNKIDDIQFPTNKQLKAEIPEDNDAEYEEKIIEGEGHVKQKLRVSLKNSTSKEENDIHIEAVVSWKQWFREKAFYQYAFVFMFARLFCNVTTTMLNFYLYYVIQITGKIQKGDEVQLTFQLALIPLLVYIASVGASSVLNILYAKIGRKSTYSLGVLLMLIALIPLTFLQPDDGFLKNLIYPLALFLGAAQALQLNTAINLISEVIGLRGSGGAFVFGVYSFLDKLITGIVLFAITETQSYKDSDETFIRWVIVIIPIAAGIAAWVLILFGKAKDYDPKNKTTILSRMSLSDEFVT